MAELLGSCRPPVPARPSASHPTTRHRSRGIQPVFQREFINLDETEFVCFQLMIAFWWRKHFVREFPGNSTHDSLSRFQLWNSKSAPMLNLASAHGVFNSLCKGTGEHSTNGEHECFTFWLWFSLFSLFHHFFFFSIYYKAPKHPILFCVPPEAHWHGWSAPSWGGKLPGDLESQKVLSQDSKIYWSSYSSSNQTNVINTNFHFLLLLFPRGSRKKMQ